MRDIHALVSRAVLAALEMKRLAEHLDLELLSLDTVRTCEEQAILFRVSRTRAQITQKMQSYEDRGVPFLAQILEDVGPQGSSDDLGKHVTNAGPGESWHQYGEAFDMVPLVHNKPLWTYKRNELDHTALWNKYGACVKHVGLTWGGDWGWDSPHAQLRAAKNPFNVLKTPEQIREALVTVGAI